MLEIKGTYNNAKVFTNIVDQETHSQILNLCNQDFFQGSKVRIMPDCHAGMGCVIGTTMTITDKVVPNLVGVDIGCGLIVVKLGKINIDFSALDQYVRAQIPHGFAINQNSQINYTGTIEKLRCFREIPKSSKEFNRALGSLGGGNHFIEINEDEERNKYLVIHSGSRNLGHQVATFYQKKAYDYHTGENEEFYKERDTLIEAYKQEGKRKEIQRGLKNLKEKYKKECPIPKDLCYLEGQLMENYLHDMKIVQEYASLNREVMAKRIVKEALKLNWNQLEVFQTIHNYIDVNQRILRKGAISAQANEKVIIPINMRDGSIIAIGKGNPDWNYSAPHGAGRLMSRTTAKEQIHLEDFKSTMEGIWSSSVRESTLDEAPMAYKPMESIIEQIDEALTIVHRLKPLYNFKSC